MVAADAGRHPVDVFHDRAHLSRAAGRCERLSSQGIGGSRTRVGGTKHSRGPALSQPENHRIRRRRLRARACGDRSVRHAQFARAPDLQLVAEGRSSADIGRLLSLSPKTVDTYRSRLMQKLDLDNFAALVKFAIARGLTSP
ncbi:MAG TPA: LuxR C-terminal-related transcriptional regulator [Casimicrobiaceae bacterium]|nr:LuxR C-terminal-related transcriptional regulator [Casimicrobiaceae bacterium]